LLDTPGIDAPREHEAVSRKQLERSEIVLFVLSNNGVFDEHSIYDEIIDIAMIGKAVMLIVNNKAGHRESDPEYREIHDQIQRNLERVGQMRGNVEIANRIPLRLINARSALNGRLTGKEALVKASGLPPLERAIETLLRQCGTHEVENTLRHRIGQLIDAAIVRLDIKENQAEARLVAALQSTVQGEKNRASAVIVGAIRRSSARFRTDFRAAIDVQDEGKMREAFETAITTVTQAVERELATSAATLAALGANVAEAVSLRVNAGATTGAFADDRLTSSEFNKSEFSGSSPAYDLMRELTMNLSRESVEQGTQAAVLGALKLAKDWVPSLMKGIGAKTMEKIAEGFGRTLGKATPFIGPTIDTVRGIYNYYQEAEKQQEVAQQHARQLRDLAALVEQRADALEVELEAACRMVLAQAFQPLESALADRTQTLDGGSRVLVADLQSLELLKSRLEMLMSAPAVRPRAISVNDFAGATDV
jgi:hypothetical protein